MVKQYIALTKRSKMYADRAGEMKQRLMSMLEEQEPDDKGHRWIEFPDPVSGVQKLQRQRRLSQVIDTDVAETLLTELGLWDQCVSMVPQVDEDAILALAFKDEVPDTVMAQIIEERESFAFVPVYEKKK